MTRILTVPLRHIWSHFFLYFFLVVQVLFLVWIIAGNAAGNSGADAHAQAIRDCSGTQWQPLFKSYQDCVTHYGNALNDASDIGKGLATGVIFAFWVGVDIILGIGRLVVVFTRRGKSSKSR
jgi:hypothetical protein